MRRQIERLGVTDHASGGVRPPAGRATWAPAQVARLLA
jgi:hypothetical protein